VRSRAWQTSVAIFKFEIRRSTSRSTETPASSYGVTVNQVEDAIYSAYGQRQISTIFTPNNQYWVILELSRNISGMRT